MTNAALIAKLEKAEEGSRALSDAMLTACDAWERTAVGEIFPDPTRNLQDAVDLVPERWGWLVEVWQRAESWAQIVQRPKNSVKPSGIFEGAEAKSPALALSIAILKAVEAGDG